VRHPAAAIRRSSESWLVHQPGGSTTAAGAGGIGRTTLGT
jgi:hypothetical protein